MTDKPQLTLEQLRSIPPFSDLSDAQLEAFMGLLTRIEAKPGGVLFEPGEKAQALYLLVEGEVTLHQTPDEIYQLRGPAVIGELGALTGLERNSRAVIGDKATLWQLEGQALRDFFDRDQVFGLRFQQTLLEVVADKIDRDQTRLMDMRRNLIRTQKSMKKMRDFLLESPDTAVSEPMHEMLDKLIKQNRRVNYRVEPPAALAALVRLDGHGLLPVVEISRTHVSLIEPNELPAQDARLSGVLNLSGPEMPFSGRVLRTVDDRIDIEFDLLIDEYVALLEGYLTRVQMLDFLV